MGTSISRPLNGVPGTSRRARESQEQKSRRVQATATRNTRWEKHLTHSKYMAIVRRVIERRLRALDAMNGKEWNATLYITFQTLNWPVTLNTSGLGEYLRVSFSREHDKTQNMRGFRLVRAEIGTSVGYLGNWGVEEHDLPPVHEWTQLARYRSNDPLFMYHQMDGVMELIALAQRKFREYLYKMGATYKEGPFKVVVGTTTSHYYPDIGQEVVHEVEKARREWERRGRARAMSVAALNKLPTNVAKNIMAIVNRT